MGSLSRCGAHVKVTYGVLEKQNEIWAQPRNWSDSYVKKYVVAINV
jgi:hypothetical protein